MKKIFVLLTGMLFITPAFGMTQATQTTKYVNQRGSVLILTKDKAGANSGTLTGTFTTAVASKDCQKVIGQPMPISGFYSGNAITLSVNFPLCNAVVAIIGNITNNNTIDTLWLNAQQADNPNEEDWNSRTTGHDLFHKVAENN